MHATRFCSPIPRWRLKRVREPLGPPLFLSRVSSPGLRIWCVLTSRNKLGSLTSSLGSKRARTLSVLVSRRCCRETSTNVLPSYKAGLKCSCRQSRVPLGGWSPPLPASGGRPQFLAEGPSSISSESVIGSSSAWTFLPLRCKDPSDDKRPPGDPGPSPRFEVLN